MTNRDLDSGRLELEVAVLSIRVVETIKGKVWIVS